MLRSTAHGSSWKSLASITWPADPVCERGLISMIGQLLQKGVTLNSVRQVVAKCLLFYCWHSEPEPGEMPQLSVEVVISVFSPARDLD